jgi:hypothetical protein
LNRTGIILLAIFFLVASLSAKESSLVQIETQQLEQVETIQKLGVDITFYSAQEGFVEAVLSQEQKTFLEKNGFSIKPVIENIDAYVEQLRNEDYFKPFHSYDEMLSEMQAIVAEHPSLASLHDIGDSYNKINKNDGYDIWAIKISDNVSVEDSTEADVFFMANIHAREVITPEIIMYYMHYLMDRYETDPYIKHLVNNREIWLIPTANPDGHEYVFTGDFNAVGQSRTSDPVWWRKNMRDNNSNGYFDHANDGVDLNRNFGHMWGYNNSGSSPYQGDATYRGTEAFSEPESQVIRDFVLQHDFITSLSFHSYGKLWLYPWGYAPIPLLESDGLAFKTIADSCVAYNNYTPGNYETGAIYQVNGDTDDWLYGDAGIFAFTPEVGSYGEGRFWPDTSLIEPLIMENLGPCIFITYVAGEEPIVKHNPIADFDLPKRSYRLDVDIKKPILLTDDVALDKSSFKVFYKASIDSVFQTTELNRVGTTDRYIANIPGDPSISKYYYYVEALDDLGRKGTSPKGASAAVDSFTIKSDTVFPAAVHAPVGFIHPNLNGIELQVEATDNVGIKNVFVDLQINEEATQTYKLVSSGENTFSIALDSLGLNPGDWFEYQISVMDDSQNENTTILPEDGWYNGAILKSILSFNFEGEQSFSTIGSDWEWGTPTAGPDSAFSGEKLWGTKLNNFYSNSSNSLLESIPMHLDTSFEFTSLHFWHWYKTETDDGEIWDGGNIKISVNNGPFEVITPRDGYDQKITSYNTFTGNEPGFGGPLEGKPAWQPIYIDLEEFLGKTVKFQFHFGSDDNTTEPGWYIDDVELLALSTVETSVESEPTHPNKFALSQNYPNPFNSETFINFTLAEKSKVKVTIFNSLGQPVKTIVQGDRRPGSYQTKWNGKDENNQPVGTGIYFYRLETDTFSQTRKLLLMK